jgi:hypothetical protein
LKTAIIRDEMTKDAYKMSSALVDMLIRRQVIPEVYKSSPGNAVPKKHDFSLDILNILQMAVQFFDKVIISSAFDRSYMVADDLYVEGKKVTKFLKKVYTTQNCAGFWLIGLLRWVASRSMDSGIW